MHMMFLSLVNLHIINYSFSLKNKKKSLGDKSGEPEVLIAGSAYLLNTV